MAALTSAHDDLLVPSAKREKKLWESRVGQGDEPIICLRTNYVPNGWEKGLLSQDSYVMVPRSREVLWEPPRMLKGRVSHSPPLQVEARHDEEMAVEIQAWMDISPQLLVNAKR